VKGGVWERGVSGVRREGQIEKDKTLTRIILLKSVKIYSLKGLWDIQAHSPH